MLSLEGQLWRVPHAPGKYCFFACYGLVLFGDKALKAVGARQSGELSLRQQPENLGYNCVYKVPNRETRNLEKAEEVFLGFSGLCGCPTPNSC